MSIVGNSFVQIVESMKKLMEQLANISNSASYTNSSGNVLHHNSNQMFLSLHYLMYLIAYYQI